MADKRIVAICGTAGSSRHEIFQQADDVEIWGLNMSYSWMKRWTRWFEVHDWETHDYSFPAPHVEWLQQQTAIPIYQQKLRPDIPAGVQLNIDELTAHGRYQPLFTSTISFMIAQAIADEFDEIRLLGVNMASDSEYAYQRDGCSYWIGIAQALGITVYLPPSCPLLRSPRYGADAPASDLRRGAVDLKEQLKHQLEQTRNNLLEKFRKDLNELDQLEHTVSGGHQVLDKLLQRTDPVGAVHQPSGEEA